LGSIISAIKIIELRWQDGTERRDIMENTGNISKIFYIPSRIIDYIIAISCRIFNPKKIVHYIKPNIQVIVPKETTDNNT
jgi:hypothetical protein